MFGLLVCPGFCCCVGGCEFRNKTAYCNRGNTLGLPEAM
uniref:Uncharacterized protein n=1 Tax=Arundo donax TaxID=35708 RepID=A0A0A9A7N3_ARUDO